jgi:hypothetical protein
VNASELHAIAAYYEIVFGRAVPDAAMPVWKEKLAPLDERSVRASIDRLALGNFPPNIVQIAAGARNADAPLFGEVFSELVAQASTCDWFDPNPPKSLTPAAYALARSIGWANFRASDPTSTYLIHQAERRFAEVTERSARRVAQGLPAFEDPSPELTEGLGALVERLFTEDEAADA